MAALTEAQRRNGALGVAYRSQQLARVGVLMATRVNLRSPVAWSLEAVNNALIESALINARALAYFFADNTDKNVNVHWYGLTSPNDLRSVAGMIIGAVSESLGHATKGEVDGTPHPGAWPITEAATVLVGELARAVESLRAHGSETADWFAPDPSEQVVLLEIHQLATAGDRISEHPTIAALTTSLRNYLKGTGSAAV